MSTTRQSCGDCKFFDATTTNYGECHKHAPIAGPPVMGTPDARFPKITASGWCGEFELRPPVVPEPPPNLSAEEIIAQCLVCDGPPPYSIAHSDMSGYFEGERGIPAIFNTLEEAIEYRNADIAHCDWPFPLHIVPAASEQPAHGVSIVPPKWKGKPRKQRKPTEPQ